MDCSMTISSTDQCGKTLASDIVTRWCMGDTPRLSKCCCACSSSNTSISGVTSSWKDESRIAWCCAGSAEWLFMGCPMAVHSGDFQQTLRPETLHALNDRVVKLAKQAKVTKGLVEDQASNVQQACRSRLRTARRVAQTLHRQLRRKAEDKEAQQKELYQKLIGTSEQMVRQSQQVMAALAGQTGQQARRLLSQAQEVLPLVERVIAQTRRRVLEGKKMASEQKVLSLFEPHTRAIPRHKGGALVEFGRQVVLDEVDGGLVTRYQILQHPTEHGQAIEAVAHHIALFEHPPNLVAGDRGVHSAETEERLKAAGVKRVAIPAAGKLSEERQALEHTRSFRRGYRWRAGIEGRIASLRRDYGWRKSRYHGLDGMERWLGLGIIASNLRRIALAK